MDNTFKRKTPEELRTLTANIKSFQFDTAHGFTQTEYGAKEELRLDEMTAIAMVSADRYEAVLNGYKYGFMVALEYLAGKNEAKIDR